MSSDASLSVAERTALQRFLNGDFGEAAETESKLVTQKEAAACLRLNRVTLWPPATRRPRRDDN